MYSLSVFTLLCCSSPLIYSHKKATKNNYKKRLGKTHIRCNIKTNERLKNVQCTKMKTSCIVIETRPHTRPPHPLCLMSYSLEPVCETR